MVWPVETKTGHSGAVTLKLTKMHRLYTKCMCTHMNKQCGQVHASTAHRWKDVKEISHSAYNTEQHLLLMLSVFSCQWSVC